MTCPDKDPGPAAETKRAGARTAKMTQRALPDDNSRRCFLWEGAFGKPIRKQFPLNPTVTGIVGRSAFDVGPSAPGSHSPRERRHHILQNHHDHYGGFAGLPAHSSYERPHGMRLCPDAPAKRTQVGTDVFHQDPERFGALRSAPDYQGSLGYAGATGQGKLRQKSTERHPLTQSGVGFDEIIFGIERSPSPRHTAQLAQRRFLAGAAGKEPWGAGHKDGPFARACYTHPGEKEWDHYESRVRTPSLDHKIARGQRESWTQPNSAILNGLATTAPLGQTSADNHAVYSHPDRIGGGPRWEAYFQKTYSGAAGRNSKELSHAIHRATVGRWELDTVDITKGASASVLLDASA